MREGSSMIFKKIGRQFMEIAWWTVTPANGVDK